MELIFLNNNTTTNLILLKIKNRIDKIYSYKNNNIIIYDGKYIEINTIKEKYFIDNDKFEYLSIKNDKYLERQKKYKQCKYGYNFNDMSYSLYFLKNIKIDNIDNVDILSIIRKEF